MLFAKPLMEKNEILMHKQQVEKSLLSTKKKDTIQKQTFSHIPCRF
jgi:hypothetical protein